ncbi:MAG TPA: hypothetical protein VEQ59_09800 [Polyangiaceae bacterium]|nr:hypothetical protein [Polyangiaceae bacterium]
MQIGQALDQLGSELEVTIRFCQLGALEQFRPRITRRQRLFRNLDAAAEEEAERTTVRQRAGELESSRQEGGIGVALLGREQVCRELDALGPDGARRVEVGVHQLARSSTGRHDRLEQGERPRVVGPQLDRAQQVGGALRGAPARKLESRQAVEGIGQRFGAFVGTGCIHEPRQRCPRPGSIAQFGQDGVESQEGAPTPVAASQGALEPVGSARPLLIHLGCLAQAVPKLSGHLGLVRILLRQLFQRLPQLGQSADALGELARLFDQPCARGL